MYLFVLHAGSAECELKAVEKEQIIEWVRAQNYLRSSDLQKYLKKQYDVVFDILQSNYNWLKEKEP